MKVDHIIEQLGGLDAAAQLAGVSTDAVRKWRQTGAIPAKHWASINAATGLSLHDLSGQPDASTAAASPSSQESRMTDLTHAPEGATAALILADGSLFWGVGFGAHTDGRVGELCFNTGLTGYQETLTDPSYAGQIITFTFPHIGNTGTTPEDLEAARPAALGLITRALVTEPSNWRDQQPLDAWLKANDMPGIAGLDTRALTLRIRDAGAPSAILCYPANGAIDPIALTARAKDWPGLEGMDLAKQVTCAKPYEWTETEWSWPEGFNTQANPRHHVVAVDFGAKRNILRCLAQVGCRVTVVPATTTAEQILAYKPDGVFLSNGPGDPAATGEYAVPAIQGVLKAGIPVFGICLGHQLLARALGAKTFKMARGHRGANQPVQDLRTGKVEITSQNHGFAVDESTLPANAQVTHRSLFDGSNEGIACPDKRAFSVQYHPEASPGPSDSHYLFHRFVDLMGA